MQKKGTFSIVDARLSAAELAPPVAAAAIVQVAVAAAQVAAAAAAIGATLAQASLRDAD